MDTKIALDKIKETELKAQEIIEQAKGQVRIILQQAEQEKERILAAGKDRAKQDAERLKAQSLKDAQEETALIENKTQGEINALKEKIRANFDKAVEWLLLK